VSFKQVFYTDTLPEEEACCGYIMRARRLLLTRDAAWARDLFWDIDVQNGPVDTPERQHEMATALLIVLHKAITRGKTPRRKSTPDPAYVELLEATLDLHMARDSTAYTRSAQGGRNSHAAGFELLRRKKEWLTQELVCGSERGGDVSRAKWAAHLHAKMPRDIRGPSARALDQFARRHGIKIYLLD
jgi:hypothetical protein